MELSDWQKDRVRSYLRAYRMYGRDDGGKFYSWSSIADAIWQDTGCKIGHERLRQFVEGYTDKDTGLWKIGPMSNDRIDAIVRFLTHDENAIMKPEELDEPPASRPPLGLAEMLAFNSSIKPELDGKDLEGRFVTSWLDGAVIQSELVLERHVTPERLFKVTSCEETFDMAISHKIEELTFKERNRQRWAREAAGGWAVLTPEDHLIVFLKEESSGWNRQAFTLGTEHGEDGKELFRRLALLDHQFPLIVHAADTADDEIADRAVQRISDHVRVYERRRRS